MGSLRVAPDEGLRRLVDEGMRRVEPEHQNHRADHRQHDAEDAYAAHHGAPLLPLRKTAGAPARSRRGPGPWLSAVSRAWGSVGVAGAPRAPGPRRARLALAGRGPR